MFKKNIKKRLFLFGLIILSVMFFIGKSFAIIKWLSFDSMLQNFLNKATKDNISKTLPTKLQKGDIFLNSYELEKNNIKEENIESINNTTEYINNIYTKGCNMTTDDISILLFQNKDIRKKLGNILKISPIKNTDIFYEKYYNACLKLNKCVYVGEEDQFYKDTKILQKCIENTTTAYFLSKRININFSKIKQSTKGENIFIDGNENNGPYDLLADIQYIGNIIFKGNKERPESIFFEMPTVDMNNSSNLINNNNHQNNPEGETLNGNITNNEKLEITNNENNTEGKNNDNKSIDNFVPGIKDLIDGTKTKKDDKTKNNGLILGNSCVNLDKKNNNITNQNKDIEKKINVYYKNLENKIKDLQNGVNPLYIDPDLDIINEENNPNIQIKKNKTDNMNDIPENIKCTSTCENENNQWAKELCQVNCCINKCKDYFNGPIEKNGIKGIIKKGSNEKNKLICISQCLCGEVSGPQKPLDFAGEWTPAIKYRVRFCRIPVETQAIIPKRVGSIEEVVDEINIILTKLKESGQLMKHIKTKEMFETSMQNIKLADILAFNLFIKFKPIFNTMPESQVKEIQKELSEQWEQDMRNTNSLDFVKERNKYILLFNPNKRSVKKQIATNYTMQLKNIKDMKNKINKNNNNLVESIELKTKGRGEAMDNIAQFILNNAKFWNEITETMNLMNDVADSLKIKIKKSQ